MTTPTISCVTGTVNRLELLKRLVESVRQAVGAISYEIVVVDNNSTDGTPEWLQGQKDVKYINIGTPRGSVAAFQLGYESCDPSSKYVVTLNDDIAVDEGSILRAYNYMERHPEVGQVAFGHRYQNRDRADPGRPITQTAFGYIYAQCGMTRRVLGDYVHWCGPEEGYTHYAWDTRLSLAIWEIGYKVVPVAGCSVIDWEYEDQIRQQFSADMRNAQGQHPDTIKFARLWRNRLPRPSHWVSDPVDTKALRLVRKIAGNSCRVLRFKAMMAARDKMRVACINAFAAWGPTMQVNQDAIIMNVGLQRFQQRAVDLIKEYAPDFVMTQAQRPNNILPGTLAHLRTELPDVFFFNWDGDTHYPLLPFHFQAARACDLQGLISPTYFKDYIQRGAPNVCYWPIAVEQEFIDARRNPERLSGPDVLFLGALYGVGRFPEAVMRRDSVVALHHHPSIQFKVYGQGWNQVGIRTTATVEHFDTNPGRYTRAKMALSVSQTKDAWGYSSDRLYNITATGCPALVQRFAGMDEHGYVDGVTCIGWSTIPEMLDKVQYYLTHAQEREDIGNRGRQMTLARHTWEHRVQGLLSMLEGIN